MWSHVFNAKRRYAVVTFWGSYVCCPFVAVGRGFNPVVTHLRTAVQVWNADGIAAPLRLTLRQGYGYKMGQKRLGNSTA